MRTRRAGNPACTAALVLMLAACAQLPGRRDTATVPARSVYTVAGAVSEVHDPSIIRQGDTFYLFSTGRSDDERIPMRCSKDLQYWERCGDVFSAIPEWARRVAPDATNLWAPDISFFGGKYHLYYAISTFGSNRSAIGLATNTTLDRGDPQYRWQDEGSIVESGRQDDWNAIDPNIVLDEAGNPWLAFGSYWSGIKLLGIDPGSGRLSRENTTLFSLAARPRTPQYPDAIEAPFIIRRGEFYYLFVSFDFCCRGVDSTYRIMVGRSRSLTGPYADRAGTPMLGGGGTLLASSGGRWRGPGHNAVLQQEAQGGPDLIVYHAYDAQDGGIPKLRIVSLVWDAAGWPVMAPPDAAPAPLALGR